MLAEFGFDGIAGVALYGGHHLQIALFDSATVVSTDKQFETIFKAVDDLAEIVVDSVEIDEKDSGPDDESDSSFTYGTEPSDN